MSQWSSLTQLQKDSVKFFQSEDKMGFLVPTDNLVFVFTSNFKLPFDDHVAQAREKGLGKSALLAHKNAIRSRCKTLDFDLSPAEHWGWIADVVLNTECLSELEITQDEKKIILEFLWYNWNYLTERSIRLIEKMADVMKKCPETYKVVWEIDYLKN